MPEGPPDFIQALFGVFAALVVLCFIGIGEDDDDV